MQIVDSLPDPSTPSSPLQIKSCKWLDERTPFWVGFSNSKLWKSFVVSEFVKKGQVDDTNATWMHAMLDEIW